jgi:hypothetical protein
LLRGFRCRTAIRRIREDRRGRRFQRDAVGTLGRAVGSLSERVHGLRNCAGVFRGGFRALVEFVKALGAY